MHQGICYVFYSIFDYGRYLSSNISGYSAKKTRIEAKCPKSQHGKPYKDTPELGGKTVSGKKSEKIDQPDRGKYRPGGKKYHGTCTK